VLYADVCAFLAEEAELLDQNRLREWFELFHPELVYRMPIRITRERPAGPGFSDTGWHMNEDWESMHTRVARFETSFAWAEDPPSRTRRFVTNIRVQEPDDEGNVRVKSNVLIHRGRYDAPAGRLLSAERHDVLADAGEDWLIRERIVLLDHTTLGMSNLGIFV
jgi:ethylbenzene dioxygenase beta subunit